MAQELPVGFVPTDKGELAVLVGPQPFRPQPVICYLCDRKGKTLPDGKICPGCQFRPGDGTN